MGTLDPAPLHQFRQSLFGIHAKQRGHLVVFTGGIPLRADGSVVRAAGVSGGPVEQDHDVASAAASAF